MENVTISIDSAEGAIYAKGFTEQILGRIRVVNNGEDDVRLFGTEAELKEALGVSLEEVEVENMPTQLSFLYIGTSPKPSQYSLSSKDAIIPPSDRATIEIRLVNEPGAVGTFKLKVGDDSRLVRAA